MWTVALSQLRTQPRRYISVVLAILIGTMFLAASFLVSSTGQATLRTTLGNSYSSADLVVLPAESDSSAAEVSASAAFPALAGTAAKPGPLGTVDGVAEAYAMQVTWATLEAGAGAAQGSGPAGGGRATVLPVPRDSTLLPVTLTTGSFPVPGDARGVTLDTATAERLGVEVGEAVTLRGGAFDSRAEATVTGLTAVSPDPLLSGGAQLWAGEPTVTTLTTPPAGSATGTGDDTDYTSPGYSPHVLLRLADGADPAAVAAAAASVLAAEKVPAEVTTPDDAARAALADAGGGIDVFGWILGGFAALALLVTALVIANTFQVLVAQRTRDLALLRTLGSTTGQVRASVLLEALAVGLVGSVLGVLLAVAVTAGLVALVRPMFDLPTLTFAVDPVGLAITVLVGVLVTLVAALAPALAATRVSPLQALRPAEEVTARSRAGVVRTVIGAVLALGGTALMLKGAFQPEPVAAIGGGMLSFIGVLLLASLFVPAAVSGAAVLARPAGIPGRLAGLNATRHRSRTAATASALLIGTTLVALFLTGGRTAQEQTSQALDKAYPVDLVIALPAGGDAAEATARVAAVADVDAAAAAVPVGFTENGSPVLAVSGQALRDVVAELPADQEARLGTPGTVLVPDWVEGGQIRATVRGTAQTLEPVRGGSLDSGVYLDDADLRAAGWDGTPGTAPTGATTDADRAAGVDRADVGVQSQVLVDLGDVPVSALQGLTESVRAAAGPEAEIRDGGAGTRSLYAQIIDAMLWIVVALLAVSVLIALIGVANTLSLSVIERTRENALLRALGLTRGGLRTMIAVESVLIAAVAALLGCVLGVFYGWAGSQLILGDLVSEGAGTALVRPTVPWPELALIVLVAALAGLAASLLPARRAANLSPVEGLAAV